MRTAEASLLDLISNQKATFFIPPYQRNYEWSKYQCKVFFNDMLKTYKLNSNAQYDEHFFGIITYFVEQAGPLGINRYILVDGQQRITTSMLFLIALRDILDNDDARKLIDSQYLKNEGAKNDTEYKIKLKQIESDWQSYKGIILGDRASLSLVNRSSAVFLNYQFFLQSLKELQFNHTDLLNLLELGLAKFKIVGVELEPFRNSWENPQEIFESMNSLGKPLSLADLVRNYLLLGKTSDEQINLYNKYWLSIEKSLPHKVNETKVSVFISTFMTLYKRECFKTANDANAKELYAYFKDFFPDDAGTHLFVLEKLREYAKIYSYILGDSSTGDTKIDTLLTDLRTIKTTGSYPFIMELLYIWQYNDGLLDASDIVSLLVVLRTFFLRRRICGTGLRENLVFARLVNEISVIVSSSNKADSLFKILSNCEYSMRLPNDVETRAALSTCNFYSLQLSSLILALTEEKITKIRPNLLKVQKEHIMPQTLTYVWREHLGQNAEQIHNDWLDNIGNITLVSHNSEISNKSFEEKKNFYNSSEGNVIAREHVVDQYEWNENAIKDRCNWIVQFILDHVVPIPDDKKHALNYKYDTPNVRRNNNFSFSMINLKVGDKINFVGDPTFTVTVANDNEVMFEGERWRLSPLATELYKRIGQCNKSEVYQGPLHFAYQGQKLTELRSQNQETEFVIEDDN